MSSRRRGGGQRSGRGGGGGKNRRRDAPSLFVEGGFLSDWRPKRGGRHRSTRKNLEGELLLAEETGFKSRGSKGFSISSEAQLVLAALPTRAAVYEDKGPSLSEPSSSRRSAKPRGGRARFERPATAKSSSSSSDSDTDVFDCSSSVDSELAEDYAGNLGNEISLEELSSEMAKRSLAMKIDSGDEEVDGDLFLSDSESEDDEDDDDGSSSSGESGFHPGLGYESGDTSGEDSDEVEAVVSRQESRLQDLDLSDTDGLDGVIEPSFILDTGRKEKKMLDRARRKKGVPGEKKKHKRELIARKRKERALRRGVDLDSLNLMLETMVISNCDMLALQPMKHRDLALVNKLAAVYRLKVGAHGSGKKRFPTVTRTRHTSMPQGADLQQMLKLLDRRRDFSDLPARGKRGEAGTGTRSSKYKRAARRARVSMEGEKDHHLGKRSKSTRTSRRKDGERSSSINQQPLSFVSSGVIQPGDAAESPSVLVLAETSVSMRSKEEGDDDAAAAAAAAAAAHPIGSFEAHTKGFGSRMLAKMGFVEGSGLGKDGQGMTQPLLPRRRPKSLGLGA